MSAKTRKTITKPSGWGTARQHLATWDKPALLALVKGLYESGTANCEFIQVRCQGADSKGLALEMYRPKIVGQFFTKRNRSAGPLKLGVARKAIRDYRKATGNLHGTAELLMTYVENGTQFTYEYGDIDERFYNSMESALGELAGLLRGGARGVYPRFIERLARVERLARCVGWGYGDFIAGVVGELAEELGHQ